jgi:hypothetical protein
MEDVKQLTFMEYNTTVSFINEQRKKEKAKWQKKH